MRRMFILGSMVVLLAACGQADIIPVTSSPAVQSAQNNPYPSPVLATSVSTQVPPTITNAPTALPSVTSTPNPLTITKIQSLTVGDAPFSVDDLIGWSPDNQYFLYSRIDRVDSKTKFALGAIHALNTTTGEDIGIAIKDVILGAYINGFPYAIASPQWTTHCCEIIAASLDHDQQSIDVVDVRTAKTKHIKTTDSALFGYQGKKLGIVDKGLFSLDNMPVSQKFLHATSWLTSTVLTPNGLYTHNGHDVRYINDKNETWDMNGNTTFLKNCAQYTIMQIAPSPDSTLLAVVITQTNWQRELWLINRLTNDYRLLQATDKIGYPMWSGDGTLLMDRVDTQLTIFDLMTNQNTQIREDVNIPVWHHTKPWFALLNRDAKTIDIFQVSR